MNETFDDAVRTAARRLDEPADLHAAYERYRELERAYAERMSSDEDTAAIDAVWRAITSWFRAEDADRTGDREQAAAHFADAEGHGLPEATDCPAPASANDGSSARWRRAELELVAGFNVMLVPRLAGARSTNTQKRRSSPLVGSPSRMLDCQSPVRLLLTRSSRRPDADATWTSVRCPTVTCFADPPRRSISRTTAASASVTRSTQVRAE